MRRGLRAAGALLVSALLVGVLLWRVGPGELARSLAEVRLGWFLLAAALVPLQVVLAALRWQLASQRLGSPLGRREAIVEYAVSGFLNSVLPGGIAGDARRVWRQREPGVGLAVKAAVLDRGAGQALLLLLGLGGLLAWPGRPAGLLAALAGLVLVLVVVALPLREPIRVALLAREVAPLQLLLSASLLGLILLGFALCALAVGHPFGLELVQAVPLVLLAMALPVSLAGWGPRELSAVWLLSQLGWTELEAATLATTYGLSCLLGYLPGALALLVTPRA